LKFVTPAQRHRGEDIAILAQRKTLYATAKAQHPERSLRAMESEAKARSPR
jgi:putative transposase